MPRRERILDLLLPSQYPSTCRGSCSGQSRHGRERTSRALGADCCSCAWRSRRWVLPRWRALMGCPSRIGRQRVAEACKGREPSSALGDACLFGHVCPLDDKCYYARCKFVNSAHPRKNALQSKAKRETGFGSGRGGATSSRASWRKASEE